MSSLKFGTSGLRGLVSELPDAVCFAYTCAFLEWLSKTHALAPSSPVLIGQDLRNSSSRVANACMAAVRSFGMTVENCGALPTPALALRALKLGAPAIMVTGSHIPADRNGLKFYRADGEIDKRDEAGMLKLLDLSRHTHVTVVETEISTQAIQAYENRCLTILPKNALNGLKVGVYQHSSVARDLMVSVLAKLGADVVPLGRSDEFIPVDTEALRSEDIAFAAHAAVTHKLDCLISTDGDADRPLLADERGQFFRGDVLGILTAKFINADAVVTPVTSTSLVESCGYFSSIHRTSVGSPFVIADIEKARTAGSKIVVGFEANGGVLLGTNVDLGQGVLTALITRDAMLPIMAVLGLAAKANKKLSQITADLPPRYNQSGRLEHIDQEISLKFLQHLRQTPFRDAYFARHGQIASQDSTDGERFVFNNGDVIHYRASGNAPELRCYTETGSIETSKALLQWGLEAFANYER